MSDTQTGILYSVTVHTDCEGKNSYVIGWFRNKKDATQFAKGKDIYGHDGYVHAVACLKTQGEYWEIPSILNGPIRLTNESELHRDVSPWDI